MFAVSNTTPVRYLIAIDQEELLGRLFEQVFVAGAVHEELTDQRTPQKVRDRMLSPPAWYQVQRIENPQIEGFSATLHRGERETILLAEELRPDVVLIDEQIGRTIALSRHLPVTGTLGLLERADRLGLVKNFGDVLSNLKASGFYVSGSLEQQLMQRHRARHAGGL